MTNDLISSHLRFGKKQNKTKKMTFLWSNYTFINFGSISPIFSHILKRSMVTKWHQPGFMAENGNEWGTEKKLLSLWSDYVFINSGWISPIFGQIFKYSMVTKWHQPESMAGNGKELATGKRCHVYDLIMLLPILGQFHPFLVKF